MKLLLTNLLLLTPLTLGIAQVNNQPAAAYFTVQNEDGGTSVSQQFVVKITNPTVIQQARAILHDPASGGGHVVGTIVKAPSYYNSPWSFHLDPVSVRFSDFSVEVCDASTSYVEEHLGEVGEALLPDSVWCPWSSHLIAEIPEPSGAANSMRLASAASDSEAAITPGALISIYGQNLTDQTAQAGEGELPTSLGGVTVEMTVNGAIISRKLPLILVSPSQVNALIPGDLEPGYASVALIKEAGGGAHCFTYLEPLAPAFFGVALNNTEYAAATALRVHADGTQTVESLISADQATGELTPLPLNLGVPTDQLYLSLYGTGFRGASAESASLSWAGEETSVLYVGPQGQVAGLDQINIPIPQSSGGQTFVDVQVFVKNPVGGYPVRTNTVRVLLSDPTGKSGNGATQAKR